jgi:chorismate mutase
MKITLLVLIALQTACAYLSPLDIQNKIWMKKLDCVDNQMVALLQKRLDLVEKLDKTDNYSNNYRYDREKIEKLMQKTKTSDQSLVNAIWTLIGNHARRKHYSTIVKKKQ